MYARTIKACELNLVDGGFSIAADLTLEINAMSVDDRLRLVGQIWDSIVDEKPSIELSEIQRAELDRRLTNLAADPDGGDSWDDVKKRIILTLP